MKQSILVAFVFLSFGCVFSQHYKSAVGLKGGYHFNGGASLNAKHFLKGSTAIEGIVGGGSNSFCLEGLFEKNAILTDGIEWYWGAGADLGFFTGDYYRTYNGIKESYSGAFGGFDGVLGVEYTFEDFPLNIAFDMGPTLRLFPYIGFSWTGGIAARFAIK
jgi:hypothetical protein